MTVSLRKIFNETFPILFSKRVVGISRSVVIIADKGETFVLSQARFLLQRFRV